MLAISGYASLDWRGKGSLNETSGVNRTPNSQKMFSATSKKSWLLTDVAQTMDVLEEAVNLAYEGRPGPVHIHVPENLTHHGVEVKNYRDLRLVVKPVLPDPARVAEIADYLADAFAKGKKVVALVGFGAIRAGAGAEVRRLIERFQLPLLTTLDGKGIVEESHPLAVGVFCDSGHATAWKAFLDADVVIAVGNSLNQHATFGYRADLFANRTLIHINISEMEIDKAYKADYALVSDAKRALVALIDALDKKVGPRPPARSTTAITRRSCSCRVPAAFIPASWPRRSDGCCRRAASCWPTPAPISPGWATSSSSPTARTSASRARSDRWPATSTAPSGSSSRIPTARWWWAAATAATRCPASS